MGVAVAAFGVAAFVGDSVAFVSCLFWCCCFRRCYYIDVANYDNSVLLMLYGVADGVGYIVVRGNTIECVVVGAEKCDVPPVGISDCCFTVYCCF